MKQLLLTGAQAFACSVVLTPIIRDIFRSYKVVDQPDQNRKVHKYPIPRVGGIGIGLAYLITYLLLQKVGSQSPLRQQLSIIDNLLPSALIVFLTGLIDDFFGLKPWQKLGGQVIAAGMACWAGVLIQSVAGVTLPAYVAIPVSVFWILLCTNAVNLVDGLDGLAAGVGFFSTLTIFTAAVIQGNEPLAFATLPLAGALLGFLCFNFNPATVFLGDCGSLLIGFLLGCFGVLWTQKSVTLLGITAPLITLCIPLLDVLLAIMRRWLRAKPIFGADRGHIHHRLLDRGLTTKQTVFLLYGFCGLCAVFSLTQSLANDVRLSIFVVCAFIAVAWAGVRYLGYGEFVLAGQFLRTGEFQRRLNAEMSFSSFEEKLAAAQDVAEVWNVIVEARAMFGFAGVQMNIAGQRLSEDWDATVAGPQYWKVRIDLPGNGFIELTRPVGSDALPTVVPRFLDAISIHLCNRLSPTGSEADLSCLKSNVVFQAGS